MGFEGRKSMLKISLLTLQEDIKQTYLLPRPIPTALPQLSLPPPQTHILQFLITQKKPHTKHVNAHTVPFLITHTESRAVRDRGE